MIGAYVVVVVVVVTTLGNILVRIQDNAGRGDSRRGVYRGSEMENWSVARRHCSRQQRTGTFDFPQIG